MLSPNLPSGRITALRGAVDRRLDQPSRRLTLSAARLRSFDLTLTFPAPDGPPDQLVDPSGAPPDLDLLSV